jgi:hypothetical protein
VAAHLEILKVTDRHHGHVLWSIPAAVESLHRGRRHAFDYLLRPNREAYSILQMEKGKSITTTLLLDKFELLSFPQIFQERRRVRIVFKCNEQMCGAAKLTQCAIQDTDVTLVAI